MSQVTTCKICGAQSKTDSRRPEGNPYMRVVRTVCENGHCDVNFESILNREASQSRSTMSVMFNNRQVVSSLDGKSVTCWPL